MDEAIGRFSDETARLKKISRIRIITLSEKILENSWDVVIKHNIYAADALQITSAIEVRCNEFYTGAAKLHKIALSSDLNSIFWDNHHYLKLNPGLNPEYLTIFA